MSSQNLPIETLVSLAQRDLDDAAKQLGALQQQRSDAESQLTALAMYRDEYHARMAAAGATGMRASNLRNFQTFIETLDSAIEQQRVALGLAQNRLDAGKSEYQARRQKVNSYETLATRARERVQARAARLEQRDADEHAAKIARERTETTF